MKDHVRTIHEKVEDNTFMCVECGKQFSTKILLNNDFGRIHKKGAMQYYITCNKEFKTAQQLNIHKTKLHKECERKISNKGNLNKHMNIHKENMTPLELKRLNLSLTLKLICLIDIL